MRRPKTETNPKFGFRIPAAQNNNVDFPAACGPTTPRISPGQRSRSTLDSAGAVPNDFDNDLIDKIGYAIPPRSSMHGGVAQSDYSATNLIYVARRSLPPGERRCWLRCYRGTPLCPRVYGAERLLRHRAREPEERIRDRECSYGIHVLRKSG